MSNMSYLTQAEEISYLVESYFTDKSKKWHQIDDGIFSFVKTSGTYA